LYEETARPDLKYPPFAPRQVRIGHDADLMFATLRQQDVLLHHPYESYDGVVNFLETAAHDPRVLSIKQTLYRTNSDSPIARALLDAASKKEVTVVVELKASFDEASNIKWARSFEDAGVQVFHGLVGLKTHAKLALVVRQDADLKIRRYAHLGTGNYNPSTARYYTDFSLFTSDEAMTTVAGFEAYSGTYDVHPAEGFVVHHAQLSLDPNKVGKDRKRKFELNGDQLRLTPPPFKTVSGVTVEETLIWERVR